MDQTDTSTPSTDMGGDGAVEEAAEIDQGPETTPLDARMKANTVDCEEEDGAPANGRRPMHEEGHPEEKKEDCGDCSMRKYLETSVDRHPDADSEDGDVPTGMADDSDEPHVETGARQEFTVIHENNNSVEYDASTETDDLEDSDGQVVASERDLATQATDMDAEERQSRQEEPEPAEVIEKVSTPPPQADVTEMIPAVSHTPPPERETESVPAVAARTDCDVPTGMADDREEPARQEFTVINENNSSVEFDASTEIISETELATQAADMDAEERPSRQEEPEPVEVIEKVSAPPPQADVTGMIPAVSQNEDDDVLTGKGDGSDDPRVETRSRQSFTVLHESNNSVDFDAPIETDDRSENDQPIATDNELASAAKDIGAKEERHSRQQSIEQPAEVIGNVSTPPPQEDASEKSSAVSHTPPPARETEESVPAVAARDSEAEERQSPDQQAEFMEKISTPRPQADVTDVSSPASQTPPRVTSHQQPMAEPSRTESAQQHPLRDMNELPQRASKIMYASSNVGRRSIRLRLLEERLPEQTSTKSSSPMSRSLIETPFKNSLRRIRSLSLSSAIQTFPKASSKANRSVPSALEVLDEKAPSPVKSADERWVDRGTISVSWYEGTTSSEMTDHVFNCVLRNLYQCVDHKNQGKLRLKSVRLLDENVTPHGEVVLCPFLPDGSQFLLKFRVKYDKPVTPPPQRDPYLMYANKPPDSPSAEPSPHPSHANLQSLGHVMGGQYSASGGLQQMQVLNAAAAILQQQHMGVPALPVMPPPVRRSTSRAALEGDGAMSEVRETSSTATTPLRRSSQETRFPRATDETPDENLTTDQLIEKQLRQLNDLFQQRQSGASDAYTKESESDAPNPERDAYMAKYHREEKKQVIFVLANYLVMFFAVIALSAEIQSRLPQWMDWVQENYDSVQNCATDKDALIECLAAGDFSGLVASFLLWATQSASAKRIFLFGFDTPKKLWTVVYEAGITSLCWGISYLFIRRGLNPNTRQNFLHKFWKDAVYGSLAGFNAAFLKAILKNLISEDKALEALEGRQLRVFSWMSALMADE